VVEKRRSFEVLRLLLPYRTMTLHDRRTRMTVQRPPDSPNRLALDLPDTLRTPTFDNANVAERLARNPRPQNAPLTRIQLPRR